MGSARRLVLCCVIVAASAAAECGEGEVCGVSTDAEILMQSKVKIKAEQNEKETVEKMKSMQDKMMSQMEAMQDKMKSMEARNEQLELLQSKVKELEEQKEQPAKAHTLSCKALVGAFERETHTEKALCGLAEKNGIAPACCGAQNCCSRTVKYDGGEDRICSLQDIHKSLDMMHCSESSLVETDVQSNGTDENLPPLADNRFQNLPYGSPGSQRARPPIDMFSVANTIGNSRMNEMGTVSSTQRAIKHPSPSNVKRMQRMQDQRMQFHANRAVEGYKMEKRQEWAANGAGAGLALMMKGEMDMAQDIIIMNGLALAANIHPIVGFFSAFLMGMLMNDDGPDYSALIRMIMDQVNDKMQNNHLETLKGELGSTVEELKWVPDMLDCPDEGSGGGSSGSGGGTTECNEGTTCTCDGQVRYGNAFHGNPWQGTDWKAQSGSFTCNTATMNEGVDPYPNMPKKCQCQPSTALQDCLTQMGTVRLSYFLMIQHGLATMKVNVFRKKCIDKQPWKNLAWEVGCPYNRKTCGTPGGANTDFARDRYWKQPSGSWNGIPGEGDSTEGAAWACQRRCARVNGCAHWSYAHGEGVCRLTDSTAQMHGHPDWQSGAPFNRENKPVISLLEEQNTSSQGVQALQQDANVEVDRVLQKKGANDPEPEEDECKDWNGRPMVQDIASAFAQTQLSVLATLVELNPDFKTPVAMKVQTTALEYAGLMQQGYAYWREKRLSNTYINREEPGQTHERGRYYRKKGTKDTFFDPPKVVWGPKMHDGYHNGRNYQYPSTYENMREFYLVHVLKPLNEDMDAKVNGILCYWRSARLHLGQDVPVNYRLDCAPMPEEGYTPMIVDSMCDNDHKRREPEKGAHGQTIYPTVAAAQAACDADPGCDAFFDWRCDGSYYLCRTGASVATHRNTVHSNNWAIDTTNCMWQPRSAQVGWTLDGQQISTSTETTATLCGLKCGKNAQATHYVFTTSSNHCSCKKGVESTTQDEGKAQGVVIKESDTPFCKWKPLGNSGNGIVQGWHEQAFDKTSGHFKIRLTRLTGPPHSQIGDTGAMGVDGSLSNVGNGFAVQILIDGTWTYVPGKSGRGAPTMIGAHSYHAPIPSLTDYFSYYDKEFNAVRIQIPTWHTTKSQGYLEVCKVTSCPSPERFNAKSSWNLPARGRGRKLHSVNTYFNNNYGYEDFHRAWNDCGVVPLCTEIMKEYSSFHNKMKFYLRRNADPVLTDANSQNMAMAFHCVGRELGPSQGDRMVNGVRRGWGPGL